MSTDKGTFINDNIFSVELWNTYNIGTRAPLDTDVPVAQQIMKK